MTDIQDGVVRIIELLVRKFSSGESLPWKYQLVIAQLKKEIKKVSDDDLVIALIDVDKEIRKILFEEEG